MDGGAAELRHDDGTGPYRHCPRCGGPLAERVVMRHDPPRLVCTLCRFVFYLDPKVAVGAICRTEGKILRFDGRSPWQAWLIPPNGAMPLSGACS